MLTNADSIDDLDRIRHGGMGLLFNQVYAPSTLGSFLRAFTSRACRHLHGYYETCSICASRHQVFRPLPPPCSVHASSSRSRLTKPLPPAPTFRSTI
jgi:hypothetical protein